MASALLIQLSLFAALVSFAYSVGIYEQCAGDGYGTFPCDAGLSCFRRNQWYSSCQYSCPRNVGWECETALPAVTVPTTAAAGWDQCGGDGWVGPSVCAAGFVCYARSVFYSQCRPVNDCPAGWTCTPAVVVTSTAVPVGPVVIAAFSKCNNVGNVVCAAGTACFRFNADYSECRPSCPQSWACETDAAILGQQCGGEGYVGLTRCAAGLQCYARSKWYSQCATSCPAADWIC